MALSLIGKLSLAMVGSSVIRVLFLVFRCGRGVGWGSQVVGRLTIAVQASNL